MFSTLYTVKKTINGSDYYHAYFKDKDKAIAFAEAEAKKMAKQYGCKFYRKDWHYSDGSNLYLWYGYDVELPYSDYEVKVDEFSYLTDGKFIVGHDGEPEFLVTKPTVMLEPLGMTFCSLDELETFCKHSQEVALNNY